jgi:hypothetical protein
LASSSSPNRGENRIFCSVIYQSKVSSFSWMFLSICIWRITSFNLGIGRFSNSDVERRAFLAKRDLVTEKETIHSIQT